MEGEWLKLYVESAFVHWTGELPNNLYGVWVKLLAVTKHGGRKGITLRATALQWLKKASVTEREFLDLLAAAGEHIADDGRTITILKWWKYQIDRTNADRQSKYRRRHQAEAGNAGVTLRNGVTTTTEPGTRNDGTWH